MEEDNFEIRDNFNKLYDFHRTLRKSYVREFFGRIILLALICGSFISNFLEGNYIISLFLVLIGYLYVWKGFLNCNNIINKIDLHLCYLSHIEILTLKNEKDGSEVLIAFLKSNKLYED